MMFWTIRRFFLGIPFAIRSIVFYARHGFRRQDTWSLDYAFVKWFAPRIKYFAEKCIGIPGLIAHEHDDEEAEAIWQAILSKMADGFERMTRPEYFYMNPDDQQYADECLDLFREYFWNLWD